MDNELHELEAELKRLRPLVPAREVADSIAHQLAAEPSRQRNYWTWAALPLAAAAAVAVVIFLQPRPVGSTPNATPAQTVATARATSLLPAPKNGLAATYKPVSADNLLYAQSDEGLVTLADGTTARRTRSSYVDTITWRNPNTQASLKWSVPRTEERVTPVSFQ